MSWERRPSWRISEDLVRKAEESIRGRASFEAHVGRKSEKPLTPISVDPRDLLLLIDPFSPTLQPLLEEEFTAGGVWFQWCGEAEPHEQHRLPDLGNTWCKGHEEKV